MAVGETAEERDKAAVTLIKNKVCYLDLILAKMILSVNLILDKLHL